MPYRPLKNLCHLFGRLQNLRVAPVEVCYNVDAEGLGHFSILPIGIYAEDSIYSQHLLNNLNSVSPLPSKHNPDSFQNNFNIQPKRLVFHIPNIHFYPFLVIFYIASSFNLPITRYAGFYR